MSLIKLRSIYKTYSLGEVEVPVLRGIDLDIERGEYVALMGASGSGKSTLMNILGCLDRPTSGSYQLEGREISSLSSDERAAIRNHKIGFVFQSFNLLRRTSTLDNVTMPANYRNPPEPEEVVRERAEGLLRLVGLADRMDHEPSQLSGGQQQRVAIARALINNPPIILADEPTGNLDSKTSVEVLDMFEELNQVQKITLIVVTHENDVAKRSGRIVRITDGRIQLDDPLQNNRLEDKGGKVKEHVEP